MACTQFMTFGIRVSGSHACIEIIYSLKTHNNCTQLLCINTEQEAEHLVTAKHTNICFPKKLHAKFWGMFSVDIMVGMSDGTISHCCSSKKIKRLNFPYV